MGRLASIEFYSRNYDEALELLSQAEDYLRFHHRTLDQDGLPPDQRLHVLLEVFRITSRLTLSMNWLMNQKAAFSGETTSQSEEIAVISFSDRVVCLKRNREVEEAASPKLKRLLVNSHNLFSRIVRLEEGRVH